MNKTLIIASELEDKINKEQYDFIEINKIQSAKIEHRESKLVICFDDKYDENQIKKVKEFARRHSLSVIVAGDLNDKTLFNRYEPVSPTFMVDKNGNLSEIRNFIEFMEYKHSKSAQDKRQYIKLLDDYKGKLKELESQLSSMTEMLDELSNTASVLMESEWEKEEELKKLREQIGSNGQSIH